MRWPQMALIGRIVARWVIATLTFVQPAAALAQEPTDEERRESLLLAELARVSPNPGAVLGQAPDVDFVTVYSVLSNERRREAFKTFAVKAERLRVDHPD